MAAEIVCPGYRSRNGRPLTAHTFPCKSGSVAKRRAAWDAKRVRALRQHLGLTQQAMASEMGTRQQTISEWETGLYQPRGLSERLLSLVAERGGFRYGEQPEDETTASQG